MPLLSKSQAITRYRVNGQIEENVIETVMTNLSKFAMSEMPDEYQAIVMGWVPFENPYKPDFRSNEILYGTEIVFSLRVDKKTVPTSTIKQRVDLAVQRRLEDTGREFLSKSEKREIRDAVEANLLHAAPFAPKMYDVNWNHEEKTILFFCPSKSVCEAFESMFVKTFGMTLTRLFPYTIACVSGIKLDGVGLESDLDISVAYHRYTHLGSEFLLWLWWASENDDDTINSKSAMGDNDVIFFLGKSIAVETKDGDGKSIRKIAIKGTDGGCKEAAMALSKDGRITEINLDMTVGGNQFSFTVKAEDLSIKGLKTPETGPKETNEDLPGLVLEKLHLDGIVFEIMDKLFVHFMEVKSSEVWTTTQNSINEWIEEGA